METKEWKFRQKRIKKYSVANQAVKNEQNILFMEHFQFHSSYMQAHAHWSGREGGGGRLQCILTWWENEDTTVKRLHILLECKSLLTTPMLSQFYPWMLTQCTDCWMRSRSLEILFRLRNVAMMAIYINLHSINIISSVLGENLLDIETKDLHCSLMTPLRECLCRNSHAYTNIHS